MKSLLSLILALITSTFAFSQSINQTLLLTSSQVCNPITAKRIVLTPEKSKIAGLILIGLGSAITMEGTILMISGSSYGTSSSHTSSSGMSYASEEKLGLITGLIGLNIIGAGITMVVSANKKMNNIKQGMTFNYNPITPGIIYRF